MGGCGARGSCENDQRACVHVGMERSKLGEEALVGSEARSVQPSMAG